MSSRMTEIRLRAEGNFGFLSLADVGFLAEQEETRLVSILVRCGACRFVCAAQDVAFLMSAITAGGDYVRDCSLPCGETLPGPVTVIARGTGLRHRCEYGARHKGTMATIPCQDCQAT